MCDALAIYTDDGVAPDHLLHRLLSRNPRATSQCEAVADVETQFQAEAVGLLHGVVDELPESR